MVMCIQVTGAGDVVILHPDCVRIESGFCIGCGGGGTRLKEIYRLIRRVEGCLRVTAQETCRE